MGITTCTEAALTVPKAVDFAGIMAVLTGAQIRAARALLRWRTIDLAEHAGLSWAACQRAEATDAIPHMQVKNLVAIKTAFELAGITFSQEDHGVKMRRTPQ